LNALQRQYKDELVVLAFPCNQFAWVSCQQYPFERGEAIRFRPRLFYSSLDISKKNT
jgi:glutathione peroxidase-family protein